MKPTLIIITALIRRDLLIGWRGLSDTLAGMGYFAVMIALLPLTLGPDSVSPVAPAMLWVAILLASLPQMERFFSREAADGGLDMLILTPLPLPLVVLAKAAAAWLMIGTPLMLMTPVLAVMLHIPLTALPVIMLALLIGSIALMLLGVMAGAVVLGARRAAILMAVVILPLALPILIFGAGASQAAVAGGPAAPHLALLTAAMLILLVSVPFAAAAGLRGAVE